MNELQNFDFKGSNVRTISINDEPYFVGNDIASILGYQRVGDAIKQHVDKDDRKTLTYKAFGEMEHSLWKDNDFSGKTVINESGMYSLIMNSALESAKIFKRWVTHEVLPSIRKHGMYATDELVNNPDLLIQVATQLKQERAGRLIAEQRVNELKPKADYYDKILANKGVVTINSIAKNYGMSAAKMNQLLHELGVQYKQSTTWLLYSKYQAKGYTHIVPVQFKHKDGRDDVNPQTKWTQKGHIFIYELLKANDILPMIEQIKEEH